MALGVDIFRFTAPGAFLAALCWLAACDNPIERPRQEEDGDGIIAMRSRLSFASGPSATWLDMTFDSIVVAYSLGTEGITIKVTDINPVRSQVSIRIRGRRNEQKLLAIRFYLGLVIVGKADIQLELSGNIAPEAVVLLTEEGRSLFKPKGVLSLDLTPLDFLDSLTVKTLELRNAGETDLEWLATTTEGWIKVIPPAGKLEALGGSRSVSVQVDRGALPTGGHRGYAVFRSVASGAVPDTGKADSVLVRAEKKAADSNRTYLQGLVLDQGSGKGVGAIEVALSGTASKAVTDTNGFFKFDDPPPGSRSLTALASGWIGAVDTVTLVEGRSLVRNLLLLPIPDPVSAPLQWGYPSIGSAALVGEQVVVPSYQLGLPAEVAVFPVNNLSPTLVKQYPQGNSDQESPPTVFQARETAGSGRTLFLSYPGYSDLGGMLGVVDAGLGTAKTSTLGMDPFGLLVDGSSLLIAGRTLGGNLALGEFRTADQGRIRIDSLDHPVDFREDTEYGPKVILNGDSYFLVDGAGPGQQGTVFKLDKATRAVKATARLEDPMANDIAVRGGKVYVTSLSSSRKALSVFDLNLNKLSPLILGGNSHRIAFADSGVLKDYGFVTTNGSEIWILHSLSDKPVGTISLPAREQGRSLAISAAHGKLVVGAIDKVYIFSWPMD